jgi:hypothetical protein
MHKIAILDDYAKSALQSADWSVLKGKATCSASPTIFRSTSNSAIVLAAWSPRENSL